MFLCYVWCKNCSFLKNIDGHDYKSFSKIFILIILNNFRLNMNFAVTTSIHCFTISPNLFKVIGVWI